VIKIVFELIVEISLFDEAEIFADLPHCASHENSVVRSM